MASHSWECVAAAPKRRRHAWEHEGGDPPPVDPESDSDFELEPDSPGVEYVAAMLQLLHARTLNASQFCVLMYWAGLAGIQDARKYGYPPGQPSGHYQRHLDAAMELPKSAEDLYEMQVPGHAKHALGRQIHTCHVFVPHEQLSQAMVAPAFLTRLNECLEPGILPDAYWQHPLVRDEPTRVVPLALYVDGVPYSNTDSVIGYWVTCLATGAKFIVAAFRKRLLCQCGCRGWCSHYAILQFLRWTFVALAEGKYPAERHDGLPWKPLDRERMLLAGSALPFKCCLVHIKGDWCEYAGTLGFPTWNDGIRPCFACPAFGDNMFETVGHTIGALAWEENADDDYEQACQRCEKRIVLNEENKNLVCSLLRFDKRSAGSKGLALTMAIPALGLEAGDRLEPSPTLPDVCALEDQDAPVAVIFWRVSDESLARHRNPLFCVEIGVSPTKNLTVDELHAVNLGVMQWWCKHAIWHVISCGVYGNVGTLEEKHLAAVLGIRHDLMAWYKSSAREYPKLTRLSDLTVKMLGTASAQKCKTKGAETWGLLLFLVHLLARCAGQVGAEGAVLLQAGQALKRMVAIWNECDRGQMSAVLQQDRLTEIQGRYTS
jgi:hypothetical protein